MKTAIFVISVLLSMLVMLSARGNPAPKPTSQPITIHNSKELNTLPNKLHDKTIFVMPGKYDASAKTIDWQRVILCAANPNDPPMLRLPAAQDFRWLFNTVATTNDVTIQNMHGDFPSARSGFLHGLGGDQIRLIGCSQNIGNVFWNERRAGRVYIKDHVPGAPADKYQLCNFVDTLDELIVDERGVPNAAFCQGPHESDIRDMQSKHSVYLAVHCIGSGYKFAWQDRAGGLHEHIDCVVTGGSHHANSCLTIGWMAPSAGIPANSLACSRWTGGSIEGWGQENKTCKRIEIIGVKINGKLTTQTITN